MPESMLRSTFANRIALYFGLLFSAGMALLFGLWYYGLPALGIAGASEQRLALAVRILELKADQRSAQLAEGLGERRGDVLVMAENALLANALTVGRVPAQRSAEAHFERLQRAYPDRYKKLQFITPSTGVIAASSDGSEVGQVFKYPAVLKRANRPGAVELLEQLFDLTGEPEVAIIRQIPGRDADGAPSVLPVSIAVVYLDLAQLAGEGFHPDDQQANQHTNTLLFDTEGQELAHFTHTQSPDVPLDIANEVAMGFEGTQLQPYSNGGLAIVVYRHLKLSGTQGWALVHYASKEDALGELKQSASKLAMVGMVLTLLALVCIGWLAKRLAQPLHTLTQAAQALGAGDLQARSKAGPKDSREIQVLTDAFEQMASSIQSAHQQLETQVQLRTAELQSTAELLKFTGELAHVGGWEFDLATQKFQWSPETFLIHEMEPPNPPSFEAGMALYTPQYRPIIQAAVQAAIDHGTAYDLELQKYTAKGRLIWVRAQGSAVMREGKAVKLMGALHDITERKAAEAELRIAAIAFESQEGIFVADADWRILRTNHAFSYMTGYSAEEALGQRPAELLQSGRQDAEFYARMTQALAETGSWLGEVWDRRKNGEIYPAWLIITCVKGADGVVSNYVATMTDITQRKAAEDQIVTLAFYDTLTGLPNRRLLMDRLEKALAEWGRHNRKGALLFVDLDNFKALNDTLGHDTGDFLLEQVAERLRNCVRDSDTVARLGGDEFVVMLKDLSEDSLDAATQAEAVAEKILETLNANYRLGTYEHRSTPSIGITLFGEQRETIDEPLKRADLAMYQAKAAGRNTLRFFDPEMQAVVSNRVALEHDLHDALQQGQFLLHYQVQVLDTGRANGAEALVRWLHPERGMVSPLEFIPLAEETGLILPLGDWVLETACRQLARWADMPTMAHFTLAVNVSPRQFRQPEFVQQVQAVLARTGARASRLKLELTEGLLVANIEDVIAKMAQLKAAGVGFSLDDFGTGYSSLSYLKRLPLDQLKIDQSFVRDILVDPNDAAISKMVIVLAESLGLEVIAEGVETQAQQDYLASQGCTAYQGYHFSRPLPAEALEEWVAKLMVK